MAYDLGDTVPLTINIRDVSGALADPTACTLSITDPSGTIETPTPIHSSTGVFSYDYVPASMGQFGVYWNATGTNASSYQDVFEVKDPAAFPLVSLADVKAFLNITSTSDDDELRDAIATATDLAEKHTNRALRRRTFVESTSGGTYVITLRNKPVVSITSIVENGNAVDPSGWYLHKTSGLVERLGYWPYSVYGTDNIVITYIAGDPNVSLTARRGMLELVAELWTYQRRANPLPRAAQGEGYVAPPGYLMPPRVAEMFAHLVLA